MAKLVLKQSAKAHGPLVEFPIGYNVKIELLITLNELKISKFQTEHFMGTTIRYLQQGLVAKRLKTVEEVAKV